MKKLLFTIASTLMLCSASMKAQITLEHVFDSAAIGGAGNWYATDIGNNDVKYVFLDTATNSFSLYNLDMSPYMLNIIIPAPDSLRRGFTVMYITKSLFDCDSTTIEYAFEYYFNEKHPFRVFRTDGTLLLEVDSANGISCQGCYGGSFTIRPIINTSEGAKLFVQKYDRNEVPQVLVYDLCGSLPNNIYDFSKPDFDINIFPNPSGMILNFEVLSPNNFEEFQIVIFDGEGKEQKRVTGAMGKYSIDVSNLSSGGYSYSLVSKNKLYQSGKFILTK